MGLSIVISGAIIFVALMYVLLNIPDLLDSILSVEEISSDVTALEDSISQTEISIDSLDTLTGEPTVNFTLSNSGQEKLWNYENFNLLITYEEGSKKTTEQLTYEGDCEGGIPNAGGWCIESISSDILDPGILNSGEGANIRSQVNQNLASGSTIALVTTDNGVVATLSTAT